MRQKTRKPVEEMQIDQVNLDSNGTNFLHNYLILISIYAIM